MLPKTRNGVLENSAKLFGLAHLPHRKGCLVQDQHHRLEQSLAAAARSVSQSFRSSSNFPQKLYKPSSNTQSISLCHLHHRVSPPSRGNGLGRKRMHRCVAIGPKSFNLRVTLRGVRTTRASAQHKGGVKAEYYEYYRLSLERHPGLLGSSRKLCLAPVS